MRFQNELTMDREGKSGDCRDLAAIPGRFMTHDFHVQELGDDHRILLGTLFLTMYKWHHGRPELTRTQVFLFLSLSLSLYPSDLVRNLRSQSQM
jgi:hypothetical protein